MLSRSALTDVLQSLLSSELLASRGRGSPDARPPIRVPSAWLEAMRMDDGLEDDLGFDSLEKLRLAASVNEMFHLHEVGCEDSLLTDATFGAWIDRVEAAWHSGVASVTFTTSGTTGRPKRCSHDAVHLRTEIAFLADLFRDRQRIVSLVPTHHVYGFLFCALLPDALAIQHLDATLFSPGALARALVPGDLVVTFPERWRWLERSVPAWPDDVEGVVSTAPCPPDLIAALRGRGLSAMTEVYGSTETAGVAVRRWPEPSYQLMPHWRFDDPVRDDAPAIVHRSGRRHELPDGIWALDRDRFTLTGRRDGAVQVGGVNVYPDEIAARLREHPGVREAVVRLMCPEEGDRLKAFVVPGAAVDPAALLADLQAWIMTSLPTPARPTSITLGPRLPIGAMGKAVDWSI